MTIESRLAEVFTALQEEDFRPQGMIFSERMKRQTALRERLRKLLLEVARDQQQRCAEAVNALSPTTKTIVQGCVFKDAAHQAVMNAKLD